MASHHCIGMPCYICHPDLNPNRDKELKMWPDSLEQAIDEIAAMLKCEKWENPVEVAAKVRTLWLQHAALMGAIRNLKDETLIALDQTPLKDALEVLKKMDEYWADPVAHPRTSVVICADTNGHGFDCCCGPCIGKDYCHEYEE